MNPEFWSGAFAALACVCVGGLIVFVMMLYWVGGDGGGGAMRAPDPDPDGLEALWQYPAAEDPVATSGAGLPTTASSRGR